MTTTEVSALAEKWQGRQVAVIGDLMLDRYVWGTATRISQEAPIPVVEVRETTARPGGAANVLYNLHTLGARARAFGAAGEDPAGRELTALLEEIGIDTIGLVTDSNLVTTEKQRIIAGTQQVVRVDRELKREIDSGLAERMLDRLRREVAAGAIHAIIMEDYAKGVLTEQLVTEVTDLARAAGLPIALDPHPANPVHARGLTLMSPNRLEAFQLAGQYLTPPLFPVENDLHLLRVVENLQRNWQVQNLLVTLGAGGMALYRDAQPALHVPTRAREVFDVSGAGDTVIASFMLALIAGAKPEDAAIISNHAAGVVVGKVGTVPVELGELLDSFDE